jgi:hypothetical protein
MSRKKKTKDPDISPENPKCVDFTKHKIPFKSIRTSLKSIIKDSDTQKKINELVISINDIVIDTYQLISNLSFCFNIVNNSVIPPLSLNLHIVSNY